MSDDIKIVKTLATESLAARAMKKCEIIITHTVQNLTTQRTSTLLATILSTVTRQLD